MTYSTFDMFQWMDRDVRAAFTALVKRRRYDAGQMIYIQEEPGYEMFRLVSGSVRMSVTRRDGREIVYLLLEPGDFFGDSSLVDGGSRPQTAEALTNAELEVIDLAAFKQLRAQHRGFDDALLKLLACQMRAVSTHYANNTLNDLRSRIAGRLVAAAHSFGTHADGGMRLSLRLSQSEIALMVGASRQSVNKMLRRLQNEGLLKVEYGNILIRDLEGMRKIVGNE